MTLSSLPQQSQLQSSSSERPRFCLGTVEAADISIEGEVDVSVWIIYLFICVCVCVCLHRKEHEKKQRERERDNPARGAHVYVS
jgi:hypothetical protein